MRKYYLVYTRQTYIMSRSRKGDVMKILPFSLRILSLYASAVLLSAVGCTGTASNRVCESEEHTNICGNMGISCGNTDFIDSCGESRTIDCGSCDHGLVCSSDGRCVLAQQTPDKTRLPPECESENDGQFCLRLEYECGNQSGLDNCGNQRSANCGTCAPSLECSSSGQCVEPDCEPETDAQFCLRLQYECGTLSNLDNCGTQRSVDCGSCLTELECSSDGKCEEPDCIPESNDEFCARVGATCGVHTSVDNCGESRTATCGDPCFSNGARGWFGEFEVEDPVYSRARESYGLSVVDMGTHYFAVWVDGRSDGSGWSVSDPIMGTRITHDGRIMDPGGIMLAEPASDKHFVAVLSDGNEIALLLTQSDPTGDKRDLVMMLLDANGQSMEKKVVVISDRIFYGVTAAFDGKNYIIAWQMEDPEYVTTTMSRTVSPETLDLGDEQQITEPGRGGRLLGLAAQNGRALLAWHSWSSEAAKNTIRFTALNKDGSPQKIGGTVLTSSQEPLSENDNLETMVLCSTSNGFYLVQDYRDTKAEWRSLYASFFDVTGAPIEETPLSLHEKTDSNVYSTDDNYYPGCTQFSDNLYVKFRTDSGYNALVIDDQSRKISQESRPFIDTAYGSTVFDCHKKECTLARQKGTPTYVTLQRYTPQLIPIDEPIDVAIVSEYQARPHVAFDGNQYLVQWTALPGNDTIGMAEFKTLRFRRLSPEGRWLDGEPIVVPMAGDFAWSHNVIPYQNGGFLIYWLEDDNYDRIYARRLNPDGTWAWPEAVQLDAYAGSYSFWLQKGACGETNCLVPFSETFEPAEFIILDDQGTELVSRTSFADLVDDNIIPSIRFDGIDKFWFTYTEDDELRVRTVYASGEQVGAPGNESYDVPLGDAETRTGGYWQEFNDEILVITSAVIRDDEAEEGFRAIIEARTLTPGVGLSSPFILVENAPWNFTWTGGTAVGDVMYGFYVSENELFAYRESEAPEHLFLTRYDGITDAAETPEKYLNSGWFGSLELAENLLVYSRLDWDVGFGDSRVRLHWVGDRSWLVADGESCIDDGQCQSGRCRNGQCCDSCPLWKGLVP